MNVDMMDVAYLALGARLAREAYVAGGGADQGAEYEYIADVVQFAPLLDAIYQEVHDEWDGMWAYEVAEMAGEAIGHELLNHPDVDVHSVAEQIVRSLVAAVMREAIH